jgi:hypothetical protein
MSCRFTQAKHVQANGQFRWLCCACVVRGSSFASHRILIDHALYQKYEIYRQQWCFGQAMNKTRTYTLRSGENARTGCDPVRDREAPAGLPGSTNASGSATPIGETPILRVDPKCYGLDAGLLMADVHRNYQVQDKTSTQAHKSCYLREITWYGICGYR